MQNRSPFLILSTLAVLLLCQEPALARKRKNKVYRKPVTHPVLLWARTLSESQNKEERKVAAFKLSQYTQRIYQEEAVDALFNCVRDPDVQIKVLCAKAMGRAGNQSRDEKTRKALIELYKEDPSLRNTLVRTFLIRKDGSPAVRDLFLDTVKKSSDIEELVTHIQYFEVHAAGNDVDALVDLYNRMDNMKVRRATVKTISERGNGQGAVVSLLSTCAESKDTPLALTCLSGLQSQAQKDAKIWAVLERTIESGDPDVVLATLDVIHALPEQVNTKISTRLVEIGTVAEDSDMTEKAILALGVCGDKSEAVVKVLQNHLEKKGAEEGLRISTALVLGRQGVAFPEGPKAALEKCKKEGSTQSLRTACQLGLKELETRKAAYVPPSPIPESERKLSGEEKKEEASDTKEEQDEE